MLSTHQDRKHNPTSTAWLHLLVCTMIIMVFFAGAIGVSQHPPAFDVHAVAVDRDIDTNALFYTDIDDITLTKQWVSAHIATTNKLLSNQHNFKTGEVR